MSSERDLRRLELSLSIFYWQLCIVDVCFLLIDLDAKRLMMTVFTSFFIFERVAIWNQKQIGEEFLEEFYYLQ